YLEGNKGGVLALSFSPNGKALASGGAVDNKVRIWELSTGTERLSLSGHVMGTSSIVFLEGSDRLAAASHLETSIDLWDLCGRRPHSSLTGHQGCVTCLTVGPTETLLSGSTDTTVLSWDVKPTCIPGGKFGKDEQMLWDDLKKRDGRVAFQAMA